MITCLALSDLHGHLPHIPDCDLLLLGGDYCLGREIIEQKRFIQQRFKPWLEGVNARHIIGIAGNHDFIFQTEPELAMDLPWEYLQDASTEFETIKVYGTPWTPMFYNWAFMLSERDLGARFASIPRGLDILLSHGPAYRHLDQTHDGIHVGSLALYNKIKEVKPFSVVSGHIHEGRGITQDEYSRYYNCSHVDRFTIPRHNPMNIVISQEIPNGAGSPSTASS